MQTKGDFLTYFIKNLISKLMSEDKKSEVWLRGSLVGIYPMLQPIGHALLQVREEVNQLMLGFPDDYLWEKPAGLASVGFHLQHLSGVIDRLFTYARGQALSQLQLETLSLEGEKQADINCNNLIAKLNKQVDDALLQLINTPEELFLEMRTVGRKQIPSTTFAILVHAAEHTQRHLGQLLVTTRILMHGDHL